MKKFAVVGVYGKGFDFTTGQAVKCFELINCLKEKYGDTNIKIVNTYNWKKKSLILFFQMIYSFIICKNIIIMPAQNGIKIFAPLSCLLKKIFKRKVYYIVIGGWIAEMLSTRRFLKKCIDELDGVYVETKSMVDKLNMLGLKHNFYMPNFRKLPIKSFEKTLTQGKPLRVCTYSRVIKEKGILDAIEIVKNANKDLEENIFVLDIYGKVSPSFKLEFEQALKENAEFVSYCGIKNSDESLYVLLDYFAVLFPTFYEGEGFAGTILDAFASATPIIANDWKYNSEIIIDGKNGIIYPYRNLMFAAKQLCKLYQDDKFYLNIQKGCIESAKIYTPDSVINEFLNNIAD